MMPQKVNVVGTGISATTVEATAELMIEPPEHGLTVAVSNVHAVMSARRSPELAAALADADLATPDGVPLTWAMRLTEVPGQPRVDGMKIFDRTARSGVGRGVSHFFYGSTPETLAEMREQMAQEYPDLLIAGLYSPPFRQLTEDEKEAEYQMIRDSGAHIVWVGLGMPKQELWMTEARKHLPGITMAGVGAVFDWLAGNVEKAPEWMQRAGLEWFFRFMKEPRRLWRRFIWNNPAYMVLFTIQVLRYRLGGKRRA